MIVEELIEELQKLNPKAEVYLQVDPEGNGYNKLYYVDGECVFYDDTVFDLNWSAADAGMYEDEWKDIKIKEKCVVLAP